MNNKITGKLYKDANPKWPPKSGSIIVIDHHNFKNDLFIGTVNDHKFDKKNTDLKQYVTVLLLNHRDYIDNSFNFSEISTDTSKGILLLTPEYPWTYVDMNKLDKVFNIADMNYIKKLHQNIKQQYDMLMTENLYYDPSKKCTNCHDKLLTNDDLLLTKKSKDDENNLFKEKTVNELFFDAKERFHPLGENIRKIIENKLRSNEVITDEEKKLIVNESIAIKNLIISKEDEINEGRKIVSWIVENLINKQTDNINIFGDIKVSIYNGYVHLARQGIKVDDVITKELVPNLKYFKWQYNISIDYDTLKFLLFQNDFQHKLEQDNEQQKEAEKIFSQEYIISLQPEPCYQLWTLKRLIMCWYANEKLQYHIRKIKIIINQWRCKSTESYNSKNGVLPSIVVYPRYGKDSAKLVLTILSDYFLLYQNLGWSCSNPSYFVKVNNLIYYSNGSIDLKLYFRKTMREYKGTVKNDSFDKYFSHLINGEHLLFPFTK